MKYSKIINVQDFSGFIQRNEPSKFVADVIAFGLRNFKTIYDVRQKEVLKPIEKANRLFYDLRGGVVSFSQMDTSDGYSKLYELKRIFAALKIMKR